MKPRQRRLLLVLAIVAVLAVAALLVFNAFQQNLVFFYTPTQVANREAPAGRSFRLGGLVEKGSLQRDGVQVSFVVTDTAKSVNVRYKGLLPDLFKEGKGVVARGRLNDNGVFEAEEVLAKHDENYMPPEAAEALKQAQGKPATAPQSAPAAPSAAPAPSAPAPAGSRP